MSTIHSSKTYQISALQFDKLRYENLINHLCHHFNDLKLNIPVNQSFLNNIIQFNEMYCKIQIKHIYDGIQQIKGNDLEDKPSKKQIDFAIQWCKKYNIPVNFNCFYI